MRAMSRIEILTIGDELTEGRLTDTNAGELSAKLVDLGLAAARHATVADDMDEMEDALAYMRDAVARIDAGELNDIQRLGLRQTLGRIAHDAREYALALDVNTELLADAEAHLGTEHPDLAGLLNNLAQNYYELADLDRARSFLQRRLSLVDDFDTEVDTLLQLGVLEAGAAADIVITDYRPFTPVTADNTLGHILFGVAAEGVRSTICAGRVLMHEHELKTLDPAEIVREARARAPAVWQRFATM
jgi:tetratricopeptide (TPR) repeat protein